MNDASKDKFEQIVQQLPVAVFITDCQGNIAYQSSSPDVDFGWPVSEMVGRPFTDFLFKEDIPGVIQKFKETIEKQEPIKNFPLRIKRKDGTSLYAQLSADAFFENGNLVGTIGIIRSETKCLEVEQSLPESVVSARNNTEQKLAQEAYESLVNYSLQGFAIFQNGRIVFANPETERITGYTRDELLSMKPEEAILLVPEESREKQIQYMQERLAGNNVPSRKEMQITHRDGSLRWVDVFTRSIEYLGRRAEQAVYIDITERKLAETRLRESEARFRSLVESAPEAIVVLDVETGKFKDFNKKACQLFKLSGEDLLGIKLAELSPSMQPDGRASNESALEKMQLAATGEPQFFEWLHLNADGKEISCEIHLTRLPSSGKGLLRGSIVDITERKQTEGQLCKLSRAVESSPVSVVITDQNGSIEYVNPFFSAITGYDKEEVFGKNPRVLQSGKTPPELYPQLWQTILGGQTWNGEFINKKKNGELYIEAAQISPIFDAGGHITHFIAIKQDITERKRIEDALKASEKKFQAFFNSSPVPVFLTELESGMLFDANEAAIAMFGYSKDELIGRTTVELGIWLSAEDRQVAKEQLIADGCVKDYETRVRTKFGKILDILFSTDVINLGEKRYLLTAYTDITERKRAESSLRKSEERFRTLVENAPLGIVTCDPAGKIMDVNAAALDILGSPSAEATRGINMLTFPLLIEAGISALVRECLETGKVIFNESHYTSKWGKTADWHMSIAPVCDEEGNVILAQILLKDITERKRMEAELRTSEARYRSMFEQIHDAVFILDLEGRHLMANQRAANMLGYTLEELAKLSVKDTSAELDESQDIIFRLRAGEQVPIYERMFRKKNGDIFPVEINVELVRDKYGNPLHIQSVVRDITERRQAETELKLIKQRYDELAEHIPVGVYRLRRLVSGKFEFEYFSSRACKILGVEHKAVMNNSDIATFELVYPDDRESYARAFQYAMEDEPHDYAWMGRGIIQGETHWIETTAKHTILESGEVVWDGMLADITERVIADETLKKQNRMLQVLHDVTLDIGSATDILTLFSRIMRNATDLLDANQGGCLLLYDAQQNLLLLIDGTGIGENLVGKFMRPGEGIAGQVFEAQKPLVIHEYQSWGGRVEFDGFSTPNSSLGVPLLGDEEVIGVLLLFADNQRRIFSEADIAVAEMFAAQATVAYRNIELYELTERELVERKRAEEREREQRALAEALRGAAEALSSSLNLNEILTKILDNVGDVVPYTAISVLWVDENKLRYMRLHGFDREQEQWLRQQSFMVDDFATYQQCVESLKPIVVSNTISDSRWISLPETRWIQSHVEVPVIVGGKVVAIINLDNEKPGFYTTAHAKSLQVFANQVAIAIQNAMLFEEVRNLATVDELTGLYNRRGFFEVCRREVGRLQRFGRSISALFVDIDHFKQFNDRYSYEVGDQVLRLVAQTLLKNVREIDVVGRYGGEEIAILLPEINKSSAVELAERLRTKIESLRFSSDYGELSITVSIGVATLVSAQDQTIVTGAEKQTKILDSLIAEAGEVLHIAKQQGRNRVAAKD